MGVNTTKLAGYRALINEIMTWVKSLPSYDETNLNPYSEVTGYLFEVMNDLEYIEDDLNRQEMVVKEEVVERGE